VLYDGDCGFCSLTVDVLSDLDLESRLEFVPLQHARLHPERPELTEMAERYPLQQSIHVRRADGRVSAGGRAVLEILDALPVGWLFRPWNIVPGLPAALELGYRAVAGRRGTLSRFIARLGGPAPKCDLHPPWGD
jgi:predicted DCC family thiol-disulfide oxidoreductase YuxK